MILCFAKAAGLWEWWLGDDRPNIAEVVETHPLLKLVLNRYVKFWKERRPKI
jgi:hypothetical protein